MRSSNYTRTSYLMALFTERYTSTLNHGRGDARRALMLATKGQSGKRSLRTNMHNDAAPKMQSDRSILSPRLDILP